MQFTSPGRTNILLPNDNFLDLQYDEIISMLKIDPNTSVFFFKATALVLIAMTSLEVRSNLSSPKLVSSVYSMAVSIGKHSKDEGLGVGQIFNAFLYLSENETALHRKTIGS